MTPASGGLNLPLVILDDPGEDWQGRAPQLKRIGIRRIERLNHREQLTQFLDTHSAAALVLDPDWLLPASSTTVADLLAAYPDLPLILVTARGSVNQAVECLRQGVCDYLVKPLEPHRLLAALRRALEWRQQRRLLGEISAHSKHELAHPDAFSTIVALNEQMRALFRYTEAVARSPEPVLISGETGVGKELLSEAVHRLSGRNGRFVALNAAGLDDNLFSDTLFGHRRGAFTGAADAREGLVAQAAGGTLFLDEIGDLEIASQVKLLRLLQEQAYFPLGSDVQRHSDVRVVCATNRDLTQRMQEGGFRADLYYRLSVHHIRIPPLRDRKDDIPALVAHFLEEAGRALDKDPPAVPSELHALLGAYHFPGNVRELRAMVMDAMAVHGGGQMLSLERFRHTIRDQAPSRRPDPAGQRLIQLLGRFPTLREAVDELILEAMAQAGGNQGTAATLLGISRPALNRRLALRRRMDA